MLALTGSSPFGRLNLAKTRDAAGRAQRPGQLVSVIVVRSRQCHSEGQATRWYSGRGAQHPHSVSVDALRALRTQKVQPMTLSLHVRGGFPGKVPREVTPVGGHVVGRECLQPETSCEWPGAGKYPARAHPASGHTSGIRSVSLLPGAEVGHDSPDQGNCV